MINQFVLVGRVINIIEADEYGTGSLILRTATPRSEKNSDGEYITDTFDIIVRNKGHMTSSVVEYLHKGDLCGFKGSFESLKYEHSGKVYRRVLLVASKISFLSSSSNNSSVSVEYEEASSNED